MPIGRSLPNCGSSCCLRDGVPRVTDRSDDARARDEFSVLDESERKVLSSMTAIWPRQDSAGDRGFAPRTQASCGSDDGISLPITIGGEVSIIARRRSSLAKLITLATFRPMVDRLYLGARLRIPSTGGIGSLSLLFVVNRVSGVDPGAYTLARSGRRLVRQDNSPFYRTRSERGLQDAAQLRSGRRARSMHSYIRRYRGSSTSLHCRGS